MTSATEGSAHLVAPREDERLLAQPPLAGVGPMAQANAQLLDHQPYDCQGRALHQLRRWAREEAVAIAAQWTGIDWRRLAAQPPGDSAPSIPGLFIVGHQPELYHPGVWAKNFALCALSRRWGRLPLNLIVDNDVIKTTSAPVPSGSPREPEIAFVPFDRWQSSRPLEETHVADPVTFESFADRVRSQMSEYPFEPLVSEFWPEVVTLAREGRPIGECLARARHTLEKKWGCENLELPISQLCGLDSFRWFACHLLAQAGRFQQVHNSCLEEFRRQRRIQSPGRPVPPLASEGDWYEAPFWVWWPDEPQRHRLWACQTAKQLRLRADQRELGLLPLNPDADACCAVEQLREWETKGIKLRPRALTNTLFARLVLGEVFIHGIGGAGYDELTDEIIRQFFGFEPPGFVAVSATLHLPVPEKFPDAERERRTLQRALRDLKWNPDRHLDENCHSPEAQELVERKQALCSKRPNDPDERRERFLQFRRINQALQRWVEPQRHQFVQKLQEADHHWRAHRVLTNREYAFCLYPAEKLRRFYHHITESL